MAMAEWNGTDPVLDTRALPLQVDVDATFRALGGYWRVLSQTVRLLEECGEVAASQTLDELVDECADVVITTTGIANQLGVGLEPYYQAASLPRDLTVPIIPNFDRGVSQLLIASGHLSRAVNAVAGDKQMRPGQSIPCIGTAITDVHAHAAALGNLAGKPFLAVIGTKLAHTRVRDAGRFERTIHLPGTRTAEYLAPVTHISAAAGNALGR